MFESKLLLESVVIYETYHPGAIVALYAFDYFKSKWVNIWSIFDDNNFKTNHQAINRQLPPKMSTKFAPELNRNDIYTE